MKILPVILNLIFLCLLNGCVSYNQLVNYRGDLPNPQNIKIENLPEIKIQPNDVLSIKVHSTDLETAAPFNLTPLEQGGNFVSVMHDDTKLQYCGLGVVTHRVGPNLAPGLC